MSRSARSRPARDEPRAARRAAPPSTRAPAAPPAGETAAPAPPLARDPWGWLALASLVPLLIAARGAPLGEPVADDFEFLHHAFFQRLAFLDGGGAANYWRPLGRQVYYALFGGTMLAHPALAAALHVLAFALGIACLYRALRTRLSGPAAAAAAGFPALMEAARMMIAWPAEFQDLGAFAFIALALERTSRGRRLAALAAIAAALLCKEVAAPAALLIPWAPLGAPRPARARARDTLAVVGLLAVWLVAYRLVAASAGLTTFQPAAAGTAGPLGAHVAALLLVATRAAFSLDPLPGGSEALVSGGALGIAVLAAAALIGARARQRLAAAFPLAAWGLAWFALGCLTLLPLIPEWAGFRSVFAATGLGIALAAAVGAAHPALLALLVALRLATLVGAPTAGPRVYPTRVEHGSVLDFPKHARVQQLVRDVHRLLRERRPTLPRGACIATHYFPTMTEYAFEGPLALRAWYRDSTLRWSRFTSVRERPDPLLEGVVEYQPLGERVVALVEPGALEAMERGLAALRRGDWPATVSAFAAAEGLQRDRGARVFLSTVGAKRSIGLLEMRDTLAAERAASIAYARWPDNPDSRYVLASIDAGRGRWAEAEARLDTALALDPGDASAAALRESVRRRGADAR